MFKRLARAKRRSISRQSRVCEALESRTMLTGSFALQTNGAFAVSGLGTMMLLTDGSVMAQAQGTTKQWLKLTPDSSGSYSTGSWVQLAPMGLARLYFASNVLPDGRVFVYGGEYSGPAGAQNWVNSGEIYNPTTNTWSPVASIPITLNPFNTYGDVPSAVLPDGRVLCGDLNGASTYIYNPLSNSWSAGPDKLHFDSSDEETWVKLPNGDIFTYDANVGGGSTRESQRYQPSTNTWIDCGLCPVQLETVSGKELGGAVCLPSGKVFFIGGQNKTALYTPPANDVGTGTWTQGPNIPNDGGGNAQGADDAPACILPNGKVLLAVDKSFETAPTVFYEYDPTTNSFSPNGAGFQAPNMISTPCFNTRMLMLPNGHVLFTDGSYVTISGINKPQVWEYTPDGNGPDPSWRPNITNIQNNGDGTFTLTGTLLSGISEGASYGDDVEMSSNYPIVEIGELTGGIIHYARSFNWSNTGISAPGSTTPQTVQFTMPAGETAGVYYVRVIANGISSPTVVNIQTGGNLTNNVTVQTDPNTSQVGVYGNGVLKATFPLFLWTSVIVSGDAGNDVIVMNQDFGGRNIMVNGGIGGDIIRMERNNGPTTVNGGSGDDSFDFSFIAHNLGNLNYSTNVVGGQGNDRIFIYDNAAATPVTYNVNSARFDRDGWGGLFYDVDLENETLTTGTAADTVNVTSTYPGEPVVLSSAGGADTVFLGYTPNGVQGLQSDVQVNNPPSFTTLNISDIGDTVPRNETITQFSGGFGVLSGLAPANIFWKNTDIASIGVISGSGADTINLKQCSQTLLLNNAGGLDSILMGDPTLGMQGITKAVTITSPNGIFQNVSADDRADVTGRNPSLNLSGANYILGGLAPVNVTLTHVPTLTALNGTGADSWNFSGAIDINLNIDGGPGNDSFFFQACNNFDRFGNSFSATVTGGNDSDNLYVFDQPNTDPWTYDVYDSYVSDDNGLVGLFVNYSVDNVTMDAGSNGDVFNINSTNFSSPMNLDGGAGNDYFFITLPPFSLGQVNCNGAGGSDSIVLDNSAATTGADYTVTGNTIIQSQGIVSANYQYTTIEALSIYGTQGADSFFVNQLNSGASAAFNGQGGNDVLYMGNGNMPANFTNAAAFSFDGAGGNDTMNVLNASAVDPFTYFVSPTTLVTSRNNIGYTWTTGVANVEQTNVNAGPNADALSIASTGVAPGANITFNGGGGDDLLSKILGTNPQTVHAAITFHGQGGTNNRITLLENPSALPATVHVTADSIGALPGDSYFGTGGSIHFDGAQAITVTGGAGADTFYAQPNAIGTVSITGGSPTTAPGDVIDLALAAAQNPVVNGTAASGNVTSANLKTLTYSGFESGPAIDATAPAVVVADININGVAGGGAAPGGAAGAGANRQSVDVQFSESIGLVTPASLQLTNQTTGQGVPLAFIAVAYDAASHIAHFTFPGYANGELPDGNYQGNVVAAQTEDAFGNAMAADAPFAFFFVAGDANHDRHVDLTDFTFLAAHFNQSGVSYGEGDFNYDGVVDLTDFTILASKFNQTLAPAPVTTTTMAPMASAPVLPSPSAPTSQFSSHRIVEDVI